MVAAADKGIGTQPHISIVTPIHNGVDHTLAFLASLKKLDYKNFDVIITDDGSTDGSAEAIAKAFPDTIVLPGDGNLWWAGSTNLGAAEAIKRGSDYIFTVNNDVELSPDCLSALTKTAQAHPKALIGSLICYSTDPDRVWYAGAYFDRRIGRDAHVQGRRNEFTEVRPSEWLTGMGVLIPVEVFQKIGFYDRETFPQYFADSDFSLRSKAAGYELLVDPHSVILADITSSWLNRQKKTGKLAFLPELLFGARSPYNLKRRFILYRRHWGKGYGLALLKLYLHYFWRIARHYRRTMENV